MSEEQRECYYQLLGVEQKATIDEIRAAYKKTALKHHPDKVKAEDREKATMYFQTINEAHAVLTDVNQRAWYDSHREQFLNPSKSKSEYTGFSFDINPYFKDSCYTKDSQEQTTKNFFEVYNELFMKIKIEEESYARRTDTLTDFLAAPNFGGPDSAFESVDAFYTFWENPITFKEFAWADKWDPRESENESRYVKRLIEKENKKERLSAKREYLSLLRRLVSFVKSKDVRVEKANEIRERERKERELRKQEALKKQAEEWKLKKEELLQKELEAYEEQERVRQSELSSGTTQLDTSKKLSSQQTFDFEEESYECKICKKVFKSEGQLKNHQASRDHLKKTKSLLKEVITEGEQDVLEKIEKELGGLDLEEKKKKSKNNKKSKTDSKTKSVPEIETQEKKKKNKNK